MRPQQIYYPAPPPDAEARRRKEMTKLAEEDAEGQVDSHSFLLLDKR
jgi:hypothetical protein